MVWCHDDYDHLSLQSCHGSMVPHPFPLSCYSRPYGDRTKNLGIIFVFVILVCLIIITLSCSSSLSIPTVGLLIIGIMLLIGQLNSTVVGLGSPCPNGVICICSRAMCGSPLESKHFFWVHFTNCIHAATFPLLWWW